MKTGFVVRPAQIQDVHQMARVHVDSWRDTYRGTMRDAVLDDPKAVEGRERFWTAALSDPRYAQNRAAVVLSDDDVVGIAMAGPPLDDDAQWANQLYLIYVLARYQRSGAGTGLLTSVLPPEQDASLWVADPNPRAQAFYRSHGFKPDGEAKEEDGVREIRMRRPPRS